MKISKWLCCLSKTCSDTSNVDDPSQQYNIIDMNNSTLVNNTDRVYGEESPLKKANKNEYVDTESEWTLWPKLILLMLMTYGLIVAFF